jgi:hypothetical protein
VAGQAHHASAEGEGDLEESLNVLRLRGTFMPFLRSSGEPCRGNFEQIFGTKNDWSGVAPVPSSGRQLGAPAKRGLAVRMRVGRC